ncbi:MAG: YceI family protein [Bacteroidota bacterium]
MLLTLGLSLSMVAQNAGYVVDYSHTEGFTVTGTSTLHSWTVKCNKIGGTEAVLSSNFKPGETIEAFYFFVEVESMDGGRGSTMNNKIKTALQAPDHPKVEYRQTAPATVQAGTDGADFQIVSSGELLIGGVSQPVELLLNGKKTADDKIVLTSTEPLTFSAFNITPPSAMFGQIVCGDDIAVNVKLMLEAKAQN